MTSKKVTAHINKAYLDWLKYAEYHCSISNLSGQGGDVLNEVLIKLLEKDEKKPGILDELLSQEKPDGTTGLDAYALRILYVNTHYDKSNYRYDQYRMRKNGNVDPLDLGGDYEPDFDPLDKKEKPEEPDHMMIVEMVKESGLSDTAKNIFLWKFQDRKKLTDWEGPESKKRVYKTYGKVIAYVLHRNGRLTKKELKDKPQAVQLVLI